MRPTIFYLSIILIFFISILSVFHYSISAFPNSHGLDVFSALNWNPNDFFLTLVESFNHPLGKLLTQILIILLVSKILTYILSIFKIPSVIAEISGGLILGPSFIGLFFPEFYNFLFPDDSLNALKLLSQIGLILFMFLIGLETNWSHLNGKIHSAVVISHTSILIPFLFGILASLYLFQNIAPVGVSFLSFSLFMGIAMSITAFPVLARIIQEKNLMNEKSGLLAITAAAADDVTAWLLLAIIIGITSSSSLLIVFINFLLIFGYLIFSFSVVRKIFSYYFDRYLERKYLPKYLVFFIFFWLTISSLFTEVMGIHSLFGAFIAGSVLAPSLRIREKIFLRLEDFTTIYLLPLFFAYSGLKTEIGLLNNSHLISLMVLIIVIAILGKLGGSFFTAKVLGESWKDSWIIGILMNTRGLMELVILNIGYELGFIGAELFTMMVIMALVTTIMTSPLISLVQFLFRKDSDKEIISSNIRIMISFAKPSTGINLTKIILNLFPGADIRCFHVNQNFNFDIEQGQTDMAFLMENLRSISEKEIKPVEFKYSLSENFEMALNDELKDFNPDLVLIGAPSKDNWKEIYNEIPKKLLSSQKTDLFVYIGDTIDKLFNCFYDENNLQLVPFLQKFNFNKNIFHPFNRNVDMNLSTDIKLKLVSANEDFILDEKNYLVLVEH
jgi:Kef-type K+ transport system membrane component KefB